MREALRKVDEVIEGLRCVPDNHVLLAYLELVRRDLMERIFERTPGRGVESVGPHSSRPRRYHVRPRFAVSARINPWQGTSGRTV